MLVVGTMNAMVSNGMLAKLMAVRLKTLMSNWMSEQLLLGHNVVGGRTYCNGMSAKLVVVTLKALLFNGT